MMQLNDQQKDILIQLCKTNITDLENIETHSRHEQTRYGLSSFLDTCEERRRIQEIIGILYYTVEER